MIRHVSYYLARALDQIAAAASADADREALERKKLKAAAELDKLKERDANHG